MWRLDEGGMWDVGRGTTSARRGRPRRRGGHAGVVVWCRSSATPKQEVWRGRSSSAGGGSPSPGPGAVTEAELHPRWRRTRVWLGRWPAAPEPPQRVPCGGTSIQQLPPLFGGAGGTFTSEGGKTGTPGAISGRRPHASPSCVIRLGSFGAFWKRGRKGFTVLVPRCSPTVLAG